MTYLHSHFHICCKTEDLSLAVHLLCMTIVVTWLQIISGPFLWWVRHGGGVRGEQWDLLGTESRKPRQGSQDGADGQVGQDQAHKETCSLSDCGGWLGTIDTSFSWSFLYMLFHIYIIHVLLAELMNIISPLPVFTPEGTIGLPSVRPSVCPSVSLSVCQSVCLSVCPLKIWILW